MPRKLREVIAVHCSAEAVPFAHKALVGDASRHGNVIEQVPAAHSQLYKTVNMCRQLEKADAA